MPQSIVIWGGANLPWLWLPLARELKSRHRAAIHVLCMNEQSVRYWKERDPDSVIDTFTTTNHFFLRYGEWQHGAPRELYARARLYEERYGAYITDILQADRHLGRGFSAAGLGYPRSALSEKSSYEKSVAMIVEAFAFWEQYCNRVTPDLILGFTSGVVGKTLTAVAMKRGIPIRALTHAGYESRFFWSSDEYYSNPELAGTFQRISSAPPSVSVETLDALRRVPWTDRSYRACIRHRELLHVALGMVGCIYLAGTKKRNGVVTIGNVLLRDKLRVRWRRYRDLHAFDTMPLVSPQELRTCSYVFYPMHMEPETALSMKSPEFNEQFAAIELLAKNLPAGVLLVVKEHLAAIGLRPPAFYQSLLAIPNVLLVNPSAYAVDVIRGARAVAVITSTVGFEAAMLGVPVISFGLHNAYNFLPHVHVVKSWTALRPLLQRLCAEPTPEERAQWRADGLRLLAAVQQSSFDLSWSDYASEDRPLATEREVAVCYHALMESISPISTRPTTPLPFHAAKMPV